MAAVHTPPAASRPATGLDWEAMAAPQVTMPGPGHMLGLWWWWDCGGGLVWGGGLVGSGESDVGPPQLTQRSPTRPEEHAAQNGASVDGARGPLGDGA
eukprot:CAMPEP_0119481330 /NCGR_PEP_ID=MMETSP1344-20130328/9724_1 /TAXON_ID=236787 /ORGANISM="Florenciella parvula, Strain CCMP2471" /LENGTH=97 /DNA_ID=CAMNT_0007515703 /DNA_START=255 /DNA_END=546 /DNA_ORIENTATION=-